MIEQERADLDRRAMTAAALNAWLRYKESGGKTKLKGYLDALGLLDKPEKEPKMTKKQRKTFLAQQKKRALLIMNADRKHRLKK